jgi:MoaA/NifB/PqqE/SkfB family radical SAM enzyme
MKGIIARFKVNLFFALPFNTYIVNILKHKLFSGLYIPQVIQLEVTNYCNAKCILCPYTKITRPKGYMPWHIFEKIINECSQFEKGRGLKLILHKDGEPLMDPMLFKRIDYIKAKLKKSTVHFNTNATLLNEDKAINILNSSLDSITFSVDGTSKETYEKIREGLKYDVVVKNVNNFFDKKKELNKKIHVTMQMVVNKDNMHEIGKYKKLWGGKADRIFIKKAHNFLVQKTSVHGSDLSERQLSRCTQLFFLMLFYWNGDVALCCWDYDNLAGLGNIEKDSLLGIYNNAKFNVIRSAMKRKNCKYIKPCNICSQIYGKDGKQWA